MTYCGDIFHFHVCDQWHTQELAIDEEVKFHIFVIHWNKLGKKSIFRCHCLLNIIDDNSIVAGSGEQSQEKRREKTEITSMEVTSFRWVANGFQRITWIKRQDILLLGFRGLHLPLNYSPNPFICSYVLPNSSGASSLFHMELPTAHPGLYHR